MRWWLFTLWLIGFGVIQSAKAHDTTRPLEAFVNQAHQSIDIMIYRWHGLGSNHSDPMTKALLRAKQRGVQVRLLLHQDHPMDESRHQRIEDVIQKHWCDQHHVACTWSSLGFCHSHAKIILVDHRKVMVMTGNLPWDVGPRATVNHLIQTDQATTVQYLQKLFEMDIRNAHTDSNHTPFPIPKTLLISPINSEAQLLHMINQAHQSIWIEQPFLDAHHHLPTRLIQGLQRALKRGVTIKLLTSLKHHRLNPSLPHGPGFQVRSLNQRFIHSKTLLIDQRSLIIGSLNWSTASLHCNREISLITEKPKAIRAWRMDFDHLWRQAESAQRLVSRNPYVIN